jgi:hypothetical protein
MTVQRDLTSSPQAASAVAGSIHPVSPETVALVEQLMAGVLRSLRGEASAREAQEAGAIEYDSWLRQLH